MMRSNWKAVGGFLVAALLGAPGWGAESPQPGTLNYIEGRATLGSQALSDHSVGSTRMAAGQSLSTQDGRAEILLAPGIFLRIDHQSSVQMVDPGLADTIVTLQHGRALVEVAEIRPENNVRLNAAGASVRLLKPGLYDFDADHGQIRVFDGKAAVQAGNKTIDIKGEHEVALQVAGKWKARKFDKKAGEDDFYRWASLRSSYLAEANVDAARTYLAGGEGGWYGAGWYWDPWFGAYTFIPTDGIFYGPFGWGFYSPWTVGFAPYFGYPYRYGFGYGGFAHRFGPGYRPFYGPGNRAGHAYRTGTGRFGGFGRGGFGGRSGGFSRGGVRAGGFHGGGHSGGGGHR